MAIPLPSTWWFPRTHIDESCASSELHNLFTFTNWPTAPPREDGRPGINRTRAPVLRERRMNRWGLLRRQGRVDLYASCQACRWKMNLNFFRPVEKTGSLFCVTLNLFHLHLVWTILSLAWQWQMWFIYLFKRLNTTARHKIHVQSWYDVWLWI